MTGALRRERKVETPGSGDAGTEGTPTGLTRRTFLKLAAAGAGSAALAACAPSIPVPGAASGEKVQLVYQDSRVEWFPPMVQRMLEEFHETHPNIRVFYTPEPESQNIQDKMLAAMQTGTAPDVFQGCCSWFPIWAQNGHTLDLRPYIDADLDREIIEDWDQAQYAALSTRDGRQYGVPKYHGALALYYNKDLFDADGIDYPDGSWDHDDYLEAMRRLTHDQAGGQPPVWGGMTYVTWDRIQVHVNGWGGHLVDPNDPRLCRMADPEALDALEWLRARMQDDRVMATTLDVQRLWPNDAFAAGRLATIEDGSWNLRGILENSDFRVGVAPFPAGPVRRVTLASTDGFGIYSGTKHPEAAWELVKFLLGKDFGRAMIQAHLLQPARASLVDEWAGYIQNEFPAKAKELDARVFADGHIKGYSVTGEVAANMGEATRIANPAWDRILTLGQEPVDSMKKIARDIEHAQRGS